MKVVTVTTNARLHLGFLDLDSGSGRHFGSIGLALDTPSTCVCLRRAKSGNLASGNEAARALTQLKRLTQALDIVEGHELTVKTAIPAHAGLGSGTQLALAIGAALRQLHGKPADTRANALVTERGARSGIGVALFDHGGVVVDGGRGNHTTVPPLLTRLAFPDEWRIVLVFDHDNQGIHGAEEPAAFRALPPFPALKSAEICRRVLLQALPALAEHDIAEFGEAITHVQALLGDHFALAQGGRFTSQAVASALATMQAAGANGVGQSSWGPTGFAFAKCQAQAEQFASLSLPGVEIRVCKGFNQAASVKETSESMT